MLSTLTTRYKQIWSRDFGFSVLLGLAFYLASLVGNYYATFYSTIRESSSVADIVLSNIRVYDTDGLIVYGALLLAFFALFLILWEPKRMPFAFKSVALFILIRAAFITLTHLGPFTPSLAIDKTNPLFLFGLANTGDLFFSGHTGMPFLAALIFWPEKWIRYIFLIGSFCLGIGVLLAHLHYSIDVVSAYFITYTIFQICKTFFKKDWELFRTP